MSIHDLIDETAPAGSTTEGEGDLLGRLRRGDEDAFVTLMRACNQRLFRLAMSVIRDEAEAEDIVQEAYVRAFMSMSSFRGQSSLATWLCRIVLNEALQRLRRRSRRSHLTVSSTDRPGDAGAIEVPSEAFDPERLIASRELSELLRKAVEGLAPEFRIVFVMRAVEGLNVAETAAALSIPSATVKSRYHRARVAVRAALDDRLDGLLRTLYPFGGHRCERIVIQVLMRLLDGKQA